MAMRNNLKTIRFLLLQFLFMTVIVSACKEEEDIFLVAGKDKITFEAEGGKHNLFFECNSSWILSGNASWLSFSATEGIGKGILSVTCEKNGEESPRAVVLKVRSGEREFSVTVEQRERVGYFSIEKDDLAVPADGGLIDLTVSGNVHVVLKTELPWIQQVIAADVPENVLRLRIDPNYSLSDRSVMVKAGDPNAIYTDSIRIDQSFVTDSRATDSLALVALYRATGEGTWQRKWNLEWSMDSWEGIELSTVAGEQRVTQILLWGNNMSGRLPEELRYLSQLATLHLADNHLEGAIPDALTGLRKLELLALQGNNFSGSIPMELGTLPALVNLYLDRNRLGGEIPASILDNVHWSAWKDAGFCRQQDGYGFTNCNDVNEIETQERNILLTLYRTTNGESWVNKWDVTASITTWHGVVTEEVDGNIRVKELNLWDNHLTGTLPEEIGGLTECVQIHIGGNAVTGKIPAGLGLLTKLTLLGLQGNQFTGTVPAELGSLQNLFSLYIDGNKLEGEIPIQLLDNPNWSNWRSAGFCNQQAGFGFTNCQ